VGIGPEGTDSGWLASAVWSEILLAQLTGTWARLKLCREPGCRSAFYDTSRNHSGLWHDVHSCGNINNLRASRSRRRLSAQ
jgi:predicted RNA-binding Zn ribbon-like protein